MNTHEWKRGDRVRMTTLSRMHGYQAGDKGSVFHGPMDSADGTRCYHAAMDTDGPARPIPIFAEDEIEPDV